MPVAKFAWIRHRRRPNVCTDCEVMLQETPEVPALMKEQLHQVDALKELYKTQLDKSIFAKAKSGANHFETQTHQEFPDFKPAKIEKGLDLVEKKAVITPKTSELKEVRLW